MVTKVAMTRMNDGILTVLGIAFDASEMTMLEPSRTKVVARPMPRPLIADVVTASTGQSPSSIFVTGFSLTNPRVRIFSASFILQSFLSIAL